ncbi:hypothetical protein REJC140_01641 [Pseudorhizobium endolithicum]|uniref:Uncharacterized protein n=1 Tax=Pseudorhizobium endolithicum TaxID=1191678 RepID=A0ABM8PVE0_9HYPH|nr:hypothetical protein REQ54_04530 [Rhizobium sp. Q54]CAD7050453.1 hypothetical protein REJC140_01641 [Pseudorhizobium endolithicum]
MFEMTPVATFRQVAFNVNGTELASLMCCRM